jgi:hypothetical protein
MGRRTLDEMDGVPMSLVFIAASTTEAERAERVLMDHGVDYALSLEPFTTDSVLDHIFQRERMGLFFSVPDAAEAQCRQWLAKAGLEPTDAA